MFFILEENYLNSLIEKMAAEWAELERIFSDTSMSTFFFHKELLNVVTLF